MNYTSRDAMLAISAANLGAAVGMVADGFVLIPEPWMTVTHVALGLFAGVGYVLHVADEPDGGEPA